MPKAKVREAKQKISALLAQASDWKLTQGTIMSNLDLLERTIEEESLVRQQAALRGGILIGQMLKEKGLTHTSKIEFIPPEKVKDWRVRRIERSVRPLDEHVHPLIEIAESYEVVMAWDDVDIIAWRFSDDEGASISEVHFGYSERLDMLVFTVVTDQYLEEARLRNLERIRSGK